jgi:hypothetical protein
VVAVGDCARNCGAFAGAYGVAGAVSDVVPVDVEIAGCPAAAGGDRRRLADDARSMNIAAVGFGAAVAIGVFSAAAAPVVSVRERSAVVGAGTTVTRDARTRNAPGLET